MTATNQIEKDEQARAAIASRVGVFEEVQDAGIRTAFVTLRGARDAQK